VVGLVVGIAVIWVLDRRERGTPNWWFWASMPIGAVSGLLLGYVAALILRFSYANNKDDIAKIKASRAALERELA
jgi:uncharacterized membrane-anchored protein YhcB (DUF1043 family)